MATKSGQQEPEKAEVVEELLDALDTSLDRVKVLYEQYFLGIQKQPPTFLHTDIERKIRDLAQMQIRNTALRYRYATLGQKFGSYNSYWRRTLRQIEQGTYTRNLSKIGRQAARTGADVPEEILAAMPKRMREQVKRDREAALATAKRRDKPVSDGAELMTLADEDVEIDVDEFEPAAFIGEPSEIRRNVMTAGGAHRIAEDEDEFDVDAFFAKVTSEGDPNPLPFGAPTAGPAGVRKRTGSSGHPRPATQSGSSTVAIPRGDRLPAPGTPLEAPKRNVEPVAAKRPSVEQASVKPPPPAKRPSVAQASVKPAARAVEALPVTTAIPRAARDVAAPGMAEALPVTTAIPRVTRAQEAASAAPGMAEALPVTTAIPRVTRAQEAMAASAAGAAEALPVTTAIPRTTRAAPAAAAPESAAQTAAIPSRPTPPPMPVARPTQAMPRMPAQASGQPAVAPAAPTAATPRQPAAAAAVPAVAAPTKAPSIAPAPIKPPLIAPAPIKPLVIAPSQATRPLPVSPGAAARTSAQVETMAGPFPRIPSLPPVPGPPPRSSSGSPPPDFERAASSAAQRAPISPAGMAPPLSPTGMTTPRVPPSIPKLEPKAPAAVPPRAASVEPPERVAPPSPPSAAPTEPSPPSPAPMAPPARSAPSDRAAPPERPTPRPKAPRPPSERPTPEPRQAPPPGMSDADVNALYAKYVAAKEILGEQAGPGAYGKLLKTINAQAPKIMEQYKSKGVDFSVVVKDNQVIIRAKPKS